MEIILAITAVALVLLLAAFAVHRFERAPHGPASLTVAQIQARLAAERARPMAVPVGIGWR